jgi:hypothetical protein
MEPTAIPQWRLFPIEQLGSDIGRGPKPRSREAPHILVCNPRHRWAPVGSHTVFGQSEHVRVEVRDGAEHSSACILRVGAAMMSRRPTAAEETAAIVQEAAHGGAPLMIPGALEPRVVRLAAQAATVTAASGTSHTYRVAMGDRERLEYEREGGGAPRERPTRSG